MLYMQSPVAHDKWNPGATKSRLPVSAVARLSDFFLLRLVQRWVKF